MCCTHAVVNSYFLIVPQLAMETHKYDQAESIQIGLMVDHVSEVSQWLVGIKKLIAVLKSKQ